VSQHYELFERFTPALRSSSEDRAFLLGAEGGYAIYYVPFEYVNTEAQRPVNPRLSPPRATWRM